MSDYANHRLRRPIYVQVVYPSSGNRLLSQHSGHAVTEWLHDKVADFPGKMAIRQFSAGSAAVRFVATFRLGSASGDRLGSLPERNPGIQRPGGSAEALPDMPEKPAPRRIRYREGPGSDPDGPP